MQRSNFNSIPGGRVQTTKPQLMTLWVTRQGQEFTTSGDMQHSDVELINASCELVGEYGALNGGYVNCGVGGTGITLGQAYLSTVNIQAVNGPTITSNVNGDLLSNQIVMHPHLNHGHVNVQIEGITDSYLFRRDTQHIDNSQLELLIPTDLGLLSQRNSYWPATPLKMEAVRVQQKIKVNTAFAGSGPINNRIGRFVEDWADSSAVKSTITTRLSDGTINYYNGTTPQVPGNLINAIKLVFKVTPSNVL